MADSRVALCLAVLLLMTIGAAAAEPIAALESRGSVVVRRGALLLPGRDVGVLRANDEIRTGSDGFAVINYPNGSQILVRPHSRVRTGSLFIAAGQIFARIKGLFRIDSDFVSAGVEGTEFTMTAKPGRTTVTVREGVVVCSSRSSGWTPIRMSAGERLLARKPERPTGLRGGARPKVERLSERELAREFGWVDQFGTRFARPN